MYSLFLFLPDMSTSSQTEPLWFKQRDGTGLITLPRVRGRESLCDVLGCEWGSLQGMDELSADVQESADGLMLNQLSSPDHRDTESDTSSQLPIKTCSVFNINITIALYRWTLGCGRDAGMGLNTRVLGNDRNDWSWKHYWLCETEKKKH